MIGKKKVVYVVDYHEMERVIEEEFDIKEYSIPAAEETSNDVSLTFNITGKVDEWQAEEVKNKELQYCTHSYLEELCRRGIIESGEWVINICW